MSFREKTIKKWMIDHNIIAAEIAREAGVSKASVTMTIKGERNNSKVIDVMLKKGCPWELFEVGKKQDGRRAGK